MYDVSIVVPVYNCDKYLSECIESLINQNYSNYEIVLVDDGSSDESSSICDKYAVKCDNIQVIHQKNQGVYHARMNGTQLATGKYVTYVDSDDTVSVDFLTHLMEHADGVDMVTADILMEGIIDSKDYSLRKENFLAGLYQGTQLDYLKDNMIYTLHEKEGILPYMCSKLFVREKACSIFDRTCNTLTMYEDQIFGRLYALESDSIYVSHNEDYYYRNNPNSVMRSVHDDYLILLGEYYVQMKKLFLDFLERKKLLCDLQKWVFSRIKMAPIYMNYPSHLQLNFRYYNDLLPKLCGENVVIYGAGAVGISYFYRLLSVMKKENIYWTDKKWKEISRSNSDVKSIEGMLEFPYKYIVLAVKNETVANDMRAYLVSIGVKPESILWSEPVVVN